MDFDITNLVGDPRLLASLAQEFRQLKASAADVDFNAWMRTRLREARLRNQQTAATTVPPRGATSEPQHQQDEQQSMAMPPPASEQPPEQPADDARVTQAGARPSIARKPQRHSLRHNGPIPAVTNLRPSSKQRDVRLPVSSNQADPQHQSASQPAAPATAPASLSGVPVAPLLHAASERERLIALSAALAQWHVSLGINSLPQQHSSDHSAAHNPAIEQLTQQQAQLMQLVQATQQQLQEHKELLVAMLKPADRSSSQQAASTQLQATTTAAAGDKQAGAAQAAALSAWFIPKPPVVVTEPGPGEGCADQVVVTSRAVLPGGDETLRVVHACSPTGQLRKSRQQRKAELKSALKQMLTEADPATHEDAIRGSDRISGLTHSNGRHHAGKQEPEAGHKAAIRRVLGDLLHREQLQQDPEQVHHESTGTRSFYYGPHEVTTVETAAALALQQDIQAAEEQGKLSRIAHLEAAVQHLQQQSQQLASQPSRQHASGPTNRPDPSSNFTKQLGSAGHAGSCVHATISRADVVDDTCTASAELNRDVVAHPGITLHRMLSQLQQLEVAEAQLRRKWLGAGSDSSPHHGSVHIAVPVGVELEPSTRSAAGLHDASTETSHLQHTADRRAAHATATTGPDGMQTSPCPAAATNKPIIQEAVDAALVDEVQDGRRRFMAAQSHTDGVMMSHVSGGWVAAQDIVEDIADALLDELLGQQATDMLSLCDVLGEQLLQEELQ